MLWLIACLFFVVELKSAVGEIHVQDKSVLAVDLNKVLVPPLYNKYVACMGILRYESAYWKLRLGEGEDFYLYAGEL